MTTPDRVGNAEAIAKRLTKAQRNALLGKANVVTQATFAALEGLGLTYDNRGLRCRTDLGREVAAVLKRGAA